MKNVFDLSSDGPDYMPIKSESLRCIAIPPEVRPCQGCGCPVFWFKEKGKWLLHEAAQDKVHTIPACAQEYNRTHNSGPLSRKAEFTEE